MKSIRKALAKLGVAQPNSNFHGETYRFFGQMCKNRWELCAIDIASVCQGFTQVPLYDTLGSEAIEWILSQTELDVIFCENQAIKILIETVNKLANKFLKTIICADDPKELEKNLCKTADITLISVSELITMGNSEAEQNEEPVINPDST